MMEIFSSKDIILQVVLDGKKALKDELQISASISSPTSGHKRVGSEH